MATHADIEIWSVFAAGGLTGLAVAGSVWYAVGAALILALLVGYYNRALFDL